MKLSLTEAATYDALVLKEGKLRSPSGSGPAAPGGKPCPT